MIGFIVFGLIVGAAARALVPGRQHLTVGWTLGLGVAGSVIGGIAANAIGTGSIFELNIIGSLVAVGAAVALVAGAEQAGLGRGDGGKKTPKRR